LQLHHHLADILAFKEADERANRLIKPVHHGFEAFESSCLVMSADLFFKLALSMQPVAHDHSLHRESLRRHVEEIRRAGFGGLLVVT
jgi:hypothetical protein